MIENIFFVFCAMYIMALTILGLFPIKENKGLNEIKVGDKFVGKLQNEYYQKTIIITKSMLDEDDAIESFLHYYGFEKENV